MAEDVVIENVFIEDVVAEDVLIGSLHELILRLLLTGDTRKIFVSLGARLDRL